MSTWLKGENSKDDMVLDIGETQFDNMRMNKDFIAVMHPLDDNY